MSQSRVRAAVRTGLRLARDVLRLLSSAVRSHTHLAAENLFLRKQLALYVERQVKPQSAPTMRRELRSSRSRN
jgi:putative transposase